MKLIRKVFSKKTDDDSKKSAAAQAGIGAGLVLGADNIGNTITKKSAKALKTSLTAADKDIIRDKLVKSAKKQGIKVIEDPTGKNSAYLGAKEGKITRKILAKTLKVGKKHMSKRELLGMLEGVEKGMDEASGIKGVFRNMGKDAIILGKGDLSEADVLSHELGHAQYLRKGRSKSVVGKVSHKLNPISKASTGSVGTVAAAINGFKAGQKAVKSKKEGKKESTWNKLRAVAVPAAMAAPLLIAEGKASLNGLKAMKKAGASKELLKQSRKRLAGAWGTYAGHASKNVIVGAGARELGKGYEKLKDEEK